MGTVLSTSPMSQTASKQRQSKLAVHRQHIALLPNHYRANDPARHCSASVISLPSDDIYHDVTRPSSFCGLNAAQQTSSASLTDVFDWKRKKIENILTARPPAIGIAAMSTREKFKNSLSKLFSRLSWLKLDQMVFNDARNNNNINASDNRRRRPSSMLFGANRAEHRPSSSDSLNNMSASETDLSTSREFVIATSNRDDQHICSLTTRSWNETDNNLNTVVLDNCFLPLNSYATTIKTVLSPSADLLNDATHRYHRHAVVQASTSDLLFCLGEYLRRRCHHLIDLRPSDVSGWLRDVDQSLIAHGWQETPFVNPANVVFVFLLVRSEIEFLTDGDNCGDTDFFTLPRFRSNRAYRRAWIGSATELKTICLTCLYLAYSYMGSEISYPLKQFLVRGANNAVSGCGVEEVDIGALRGRFWSRCLRIVSSQSYFMLRINKDPRYFADVFADLISYSTIY